MGEGEVRRLRTEVRRLEQRLVTSVELPSRTVPIEDPPRLTIAPPAA